MNITVRRLKLALAIHMKTVCEDRLTLVSLRDLGVQVRACSSIKASCQTCALRMVALPAWLSLPGRLSASLSPQTQLSCTQSDAPSPGHGCAYVQRP